ncbi:tRNA-dihydrouridine(47) synthase [NAD(P)(+)]-like protein [Mortierella sp. NVP85]|nr:tRNA-dihydrouridine(47) synthase [NAD(P)(+)]-like protein [Mortierella sp. NVP85]
MDILNSMLTRIRAGRRSIRVPQIGLAAAPRQPVAILAKTMSSEDTASAMDVTASSTSAESTSTSTTNYQRGVVPIKPEFLCAAVPVSKGEGEESIAQLSEAVEKEGDESRVDEDKGNENEVNKNKKRESKSKHVKNDRKKRSGGGGQTQDRVVTRRIEDEVQLCFKVAKGVECEHGDSCKFNHDIKKYLDAKDKDLGNRCPNFEILGECHYGYKCRFLSAHMDSDGKLIRDEEKMARVGPQTLNALPHDLTIQLRSFKIDFRGKTYLAPLTTVGNLPFRRICKEYGVDITCGEMAMAANLVQGHKGELALLRRHKSEDIFGVQLTGNKVDVVVRACDMINQVTEVDFVDLNMGCPIDLVFNVGAGSGLLGSVGKMKRMVRGMKSVLDVPVTVKFRMAIYDKKPIGTQMTPIFHDLGAALATLHGRSRQQRYTKLADWDYIKECAMTDRGILGSDSYMPLFGNGDILGYTDYYRHLEEHGVDGCMIARGALMKPWIFDEIKTRRDWDISSGERFDMMKRFCDYGMEHWGSDTQGVNQTRRFLLEWQSFLHRYVPVGLLEVLPQKMNDRPPAFVGRNDLETLMASQDVKDWIKLSEMILGPAPEAFRFDPKHKANSTSVEG